MGLESVRAFLAGNAPDVVISDLDRSSETASLSAAWGIRPAQIAKALALQVGKSAILLMACGDSRLDNRKIRDVLGGKPRMLPPQDASEITGHPVGGLCPFGLATAMPVYCDIRLKAFDLVVTGGGSPRTAIRIDPLRMAALAGAAWIDVCEDSRPAA